MYNKIFLIVPLWIKIQSELLLISENRSFASVQFVGEYVKCRTMYIEQGITVSSSRSNIINSASLSLSLSLSLSMSVFCFKWPRFSNERRVPQLIYPYSSGEVKSWSGTAAIQFGLVDRIWCVFHHSAKLFSSKYSKSEKENQIHCIWNWFPSPNSRSWTIYLKSWPTNW